MSIVILAEKPSVARDIASSLGVTGRSKGYLHGNGYVVTWALGHLVTLPEPHQINPAWKAWRPDLLPMIPGTWPLQVVERTQEQFDIVSGILKDKAVTQVVCATDAGREGELIFRYIYEAVGADKPVKRLWISSLTRDAIRAGFAGLREQSDFDALADAARGRSRADWLVGLNLSRAYTLALGDTLSVGRVQTPTLAMLVKREREIRDFTPEKYRQVSAQFRPLDTQATSYSGLYIAELPGKDTASRLPADGELAGAIVERACTGQAEVASIKARQRKIMSPQLYDLTELQRHANRLFGLTARQTLEIAQTLYERKKLLSYPRTDSRYLTTAMAAELAGVTEAIGSRYPGQLAPGTGTKKLGARFINDAKVTDHHAIIPTPVDPEGVTLNKDEARIYDLVCRRLLSAWHQTHLLSTTTVITTITNDTLVDHYRSSGNRVDRVGWKVLDYVIFRSSRDKLQKDGAAEQEFPPGLAEQQRQEVLDAQSEIKSTRPPRHLTDAALLTAMETAGKTLDEKELSNAMRASGLGTPATRASIIETLISRAYVERSKKALIATDKGMRLIDAVHADVKSPAMTGRWEAKLQRLQQGEGDLAQFMQGIEAYVRKVIGKMGSHETVKTIETIESTETIEVRQPTPPEKLGELLRDSFGFEDFRPFQEAVCQAITRGSDALLVMPTGAGKSLCYQLPGIARAGTTLIISPLIALMEDQVASLKQFGFSAERIHSGRSRLDSRQVSLDYLAGNLDFLFIAPERLSVPGFPEMLAKRKPSLIAVDEAHCISEWGHDFRPDYRMLRSRLPQLRPAPIVALTATATPLVQQDIVEQLGIPAASSFIHGFRRTNIAIEIAEMKPSLRPELTARLLMNPANRPAIVYAPTRKQADALATQLSARFPSAAYHAGQTSKKRDTVQAAFLNGQLEVIVATIAFGMGIDKPNIRTVIHVALPSSVEGYYQEIGRAGRDGQPSRAILLHSYGDRRTHQWFLERDYPDVTLLRRLFNALTEAPQPRAWLEENVPIGAEIFGMALEKLWIHGGAIVDPEENVTRGVDQWEAPYLAQHRHKLGQLALVTRFAESRDCHMLHLVSHFGDQEDSGLRCGSCDVCDPSGSLAIDRQDADADERRNMERILDSLRRMNGQSSGRLHREEFGKSLDRNGYERLVGALVRHELLIEREDSFEKDGHVIEYRRIFLTPKGQDAETLEGVQIVRIQQAAATPRKRKKPARKSKASRVPRVARVTTVEPYALDETPASPALLAALKEWRLTEARRRRVPAFCVMDNQALQRIAVTRPDSDEKLLTIKGMGPARVKNYGSRLIALVKQAKQTELE